MSGEPLRTGGAGFSDAVTISWADAERGWYGMARLGVADGVGSALAVLFRGREVVDVLAEGSIAVEGSNWSTLAIGPLRTTVAVPNERWTVTWDDHFELELEAVSAPVERAGDMEGYEQLLRVHGTALGEEVDGLGQRGRGWGVADWSSLSLVRTVSAWLGAERGGIVAESRQREGAAGHDDEALWAALVKSGEPVRVHEPRLSTTYDGDGHQRRAGLELWMTEDDEAFPVRAAGEVICGSSLDLGALRLDLAFFRWHSEGAEGVGRYDVLRKAHAGAGSRAEP